jgi:two-component system response regulator AtoC
MNPKKILIIDDEFDICDLIKDCLADKGYAVFTANDAKTGLEIVQVETPHLVLLDLLLPGIGGMECLRRIKEDQPETIVIVLTGMKDENTAKEAIRRGAYDFVTKPFDLNTFESTVLARDFPENAD